MKVLSVVVHKLWPRLTFLSMDDNNVADNTAGKAADDGAMTNVDTAKIEANLHYYKENNNAFISIIFIN